MSKLNQYGKPERRYKGTGSLFLENSDTLNCQFEVAQVPDGTLYALCTLDSADVFKTWNQIDGKLVGNLSRNRTLVFNSIGTISSSAKPFTSDSHATATLQGRDVVVTTGKYPPDSVRFRFVLTNFVFTREQLELRLGKFQVMVRPFAAYNEKVRHIKVVRGIGTTCEAIVSACSIQDRDDIVRAIDNLCLLLTLAKGCKIEWLYYDIQRDTGVTFESYHRNPPTKPYSSFELIPEIPPSDIEYFVQKTFPAFDIQEPQWQVRKAINSYNDAKLEGDYLEARALKMVVTMEHLKGRYLVQHNKQHFLPPDTFESSTKSLINDVRELLRSTFPDATITQLDLMADHAQGFNWYPFSRALSELCRSVELNTNSRRRRRFVNIRNDLVHRFSFSKRSGTPWEQYSFLMSFVGEVILAILDYDGFYHDWTKSPSQDQMHKKLDRHVRAVGGKH